MFNRPTPLQARLNNEAKACKVRSCSRNRLGLSGHCGTNHARRTCYGGADPGKQWHPKTYERHDEITRLQEQVASLEAEAQHWYGKYADLIQEVENREVMAGAGRVDGGGGGGILQLENSEGVCLLEGVTNKFHSGKDRGGGARCLSSLALQPSIQRKGKK
jgi:hypothetical protein